MARDRHTNHRRLRELKGHRAEQVFPSLLLCGEWPQCANTIPELGLSDGPSCGYDTLGQYCTRAARGASKCSLVRSVGPFLHVAQPCAACNVILLPSPCQKLLPLYLVSASRALQSLNPRWQGCRRLCCLSHENVVGKAYVGERVGRSSPSGMSWIAGNKNNAAQVVPFVHALNPKPCHAALHSPPPAHAHCLSVPRYTPQVQAPSLRLVQPPSNPRHPYPCSTSAWTQSCPAAS